jgi:LacI family transcriptional regulator
MSDAITLKKISQLLNISISTASRALKDHPDIADSTKQKVKELAEMLEYEPNPYAIQLSTSHSKVFGLIVPEVSNLFYTSFIDAVEDESRKIGYTLIILKTNDDAEIEAAHIKYCKKHRVAGLFACITPGTSNFELFQSLNKSGIPVVFFDRVPDSGNCNRVCFADENAAIIAAEAILKKNKKKVLAVFAEPSLSITQKRLKAFQQVFQQNKNAPPLDIYHTSPVENSKDIIKQKLLSAGRPDTIFCMTDVILHSTMKALQELQLKIPEEVAVITISNSEFFPQLYTPEITYVETSGYKLGVLALSAMITCVKEDAPYQELYIDACLIEGKSL